jgi:regulatory protein
MPLISKIVAKKRSSNCYVHFDDLDVCELSTDLILKYALAKGVEIPEEAWNEVLAEQNLINAKQTAYNYAAYKPRTEYQVRNRLRERGFEPKITHDAIEFIRRFDLLDDERFAYNFARDYLKRKPSGEIKLKFELIQRGVDRDLSEKTAFEIYQKEDPLEQAMLAAEKKLRSISYKPIDKQKTALINKLKTLGFDWDIIKKVVEKHYGESK